MKLDPSMLKESKAEATDVSAANAAREACVFIVLAYAKGK